MKAIDYIVLLIAIIITIGLCQHNLAALIIMPFTGIGIFFANLLREPKNSKKTKPIKIVHRRKD